MITSSAYAAHKVVWGGDELPTFRFSGLRITVHDRPWWSPCLLSDRRDTPMDAGVRGCMRLEMRLLRPARWVLTSGGQPSGLSPVRAGDGQTKGETMARYAVFFSYTSDAWARMIKSPGDRTAAVRQLDGSVGGSLESANSNGHGWTCTGDAQGDTSDREEDEHGER
jgi:hypothetical protein